MISHFKYQKINITDTPNENTSGLFLKKYFFDCIYFCNFAR